MAQFDVYPNRNRDTHTWIPYLLDVQHDLLDELNTRVVVPLIREQSFGVRVSRLNPRFKIEGEFYVMGTSELSGISVHALGSHSVTSLEKHRDEIITALDVLFSGV